MQGDEERGGSWFPCVGARCLGVKTARCVGDEAGLYRVQKGGGGLANIRREGGRSYRRGVCAGL